MKYTSFYRKGNPIKKTSEYRSYTSMLERCYSPNYLNFQRWGGRGIKVCERWREPGKGFDNFLEDMGHKPSPKHQIDRIDNNGDYEPENCRWATQKEQMNNTSRSIKIEYGGNQWDIPALAKALGVKEPTLRYRINNNIPKKFWGSRTTVKKYRLDKIRKDERILAYNGEYKSIAQWSALTGIPRYTITSRIDYRGWSVERALKTPTKKDFSTALMQKVLEIN